jgi:hypothetical protein
MIALGRVHIIRGDSATHAQKLVDICVQKNKKNVTWMIDEWRFINERLSALRSESFLFSLHAYDHEFMHYCGDIPCANCCNDPELSELLLHPVQFMGPIPMRPPWRWKEHEKRQTREPCRSPVFCYFSSHFLCFLHGQDGHRFFCEHYINITKLCSQCTHFAERKSAQREAESRLCCAHNGSLFFE